MCSFSLWMLALTGPSSMTSGQISMMKRASEVPPVVESSAERPVCYLLASCTVFARRPFLLRKGLAPSTQSSA